MRWRDSLSHSVAVLLGGATKQVGGGVAAMLFTYTLQYSVAG